MGTSVLFGTDLTVLLIIITLLTVVGVDIDQVVNANLQGFELLLRNCPSVSGPLSLRVSTDSASSPSDVTKTHGPVCYRHAHVKDPQGPVNGVLVNSTEIPPACVGLLCSVGPVTSVSCHVSVLSLLSVVTCQSCHLRQLSRVCPVISVSCHVSASAVTYVSCHESALSLTSVVTCRSCHLILSVLSV